MTTVKWIKIVTNIFDDEKMLLIDGLPESDAIIVIWFKLLCLAGKQNNGGVFMLNDKIPYTDEMFATIFRRPLTTVRLALKTFEQFGMVEIVNETVTIPNWDKHQSLDKFEISKEQTRKRVAKYREKQKLLAFGDVSECQYCGGKATGIDHIIPIAKGGKDIESNKIPCCIDCNRKKNDKPLVDFLNSHRDIINDEIVTANKKLSKFVTLCNVTGCYTVTQSNADRIEEEKEIDKDIDIKKENKKERKTATAYDEILKSVEDDSLRKTFYDFIKMRQMIKAPMTDRALQILIDKVQRLEPLSVDRQKKLLENAITNNWKSVYPLKEEEKKKEKEWKLQPVPDFFDQLDNLYTDDTEEEE